MMGVKERVGDRSKVLHIQGDHDAWSSSASQKKQGSHFPLGAKITGRYVKCETNLFDVCGKVHHNRRHEMPVSDIVTGS